MEGKVVLTYGCELCPHESPTPLSLKDHVKSRHQSCNTCGSKFAKRTMLKKHVRAEHDEFVCEHCKLKLPDLMSLKAHKRDIHNK